MFIFLGLWVAINTSLVSLWFRLGQPAFAKASAGKPGPRQRSCDFTFFLLDLLGGGALLGVVWANFARPFSCGHSRFLNAFSFLKNVSAFLVRF